MWPKLAAFFGLEAGPPMPLVACRLPEMMKDKGPIWDRLVQASGANPGIVLVIVWALHF